MPSKSTAQGSIPGRLRKFDFSLGTRCVSFFSVLVCVVYGGGPDIVLTTHSVKSAIVFLFSVLVHSLLLPLQASGTRAFGL